MILSLRIGSFSDRHVLRVRRTAINRRNTIQAHCTTVVNSNCDSSGSRLKTDDGEKTVSDPYRLRRRRGERGNVGEGRNTAAVRGRKWRDLRIPGGVIPERAFRLAQGSSACTHTQVAPTTYHVHTHTHTHAHVCVKTHGVEHAPLREYAHVVVGFCFGFDFFFFS